mmetsp:Transcript_125920/g.251259  ORF Transcript_125920/g.251259 Transcript_125920/m.251259 type:complete len:80 (+) Transcript_125920:463-702(+)
MSHVLGTLLTAMAFRGSSNFPIESFRSDAKETLDIKGEHADESGLPPTTCCCVDATNLSRQAGSRNTAHAASSAGDAAV